MGRPHPPSFLGKPWLLFRRNLAATFARSAKPRQVCVTIESICLSAAVPLGFGKHIWDWDLENLTPLILLINVAGSFSATAAIWSKTSFAFTMLRLTEGYMRWLVWFIIISMNIAMGLTALLLWLRCTPIEKTWKPFGPGTCWDENILIRYDIFSAGKSRLVMTR